ncbi:MAG: DUF6883 domain-containing protein [Vicinamibacterales bacterium]
MRDAGESANVSHSRAGIRVARLAGDKACMVLRNGQSAVVESRKVTLMAALLQIAASGKLVAVERSPHGEKSVVRGPIAAHTEGIPPRSLMTVWIVSSGSDVPRLVTAYPARSRR